MIHLKLWQQLGSIGSLVAISLLAVSVLQVGANPVPCNLYHPGDSIQQGFGVPWNVLSADQELLIRAFCDASSVDVAVGSGSNLQYVFQTGYVWRSNHWEPFTFSGLNQTGSWFIGNAHTTLAFTSQELQNNNYVIAYVCTLTGSQWKCGCRDDVCTQNFWQLQAFRETQLLFKITQQIDRQQSILLTYRIQDQTTGNITLDLNVSNLRDTWFLVRREGNLSVSDQKIPFVFLLGPHGLRSFFNVKFSRGEQLRLTTEKAGIVNADQRLALGALSVDMLGRGLFGLTLPADIFDGSYFQLLWNFVFLYGETFLTELSATLAEKSFPTFVTKLVISLGDLNLDDPYIQKFIDELYKGLGKTAKQAADLIDNALQIINLPAHARLVYELWRGTDEAPYNGFAAIGAQ
jgi:hypothetical protein